MLSLIVVSIICCSAIDSCSDSHKIKPEQVDHIVFFAWPKNVETPSAIDSFERLTQENWAKDSIICDQVFIKEFVSLINRLKTGTPKASDFRSAAVIKMKSGEIHTCCFGENAGISFDNSRMKDDSRVFRFIDKQIYETQPDDYWYSETTKKVIEASRELAF